MKKRLAVILLITIIGLIIYSRSSKIHIFTNYQSQEQTLSTSLKEIIENALAGTKGSYGIAIKNLKTNEAYYRHEHQIFEAGSLYKVWILATAMNEIEQGTLKEDQVLSQDVAVLNNKFGISPDNAEIKNGKISLTVEDAIKQMITISHNYAALLLSDRIKLSTVKAFLDKNNLNESSLGEPPKTTPYDIASFFEKLYKGELANWENTQKMISLLQGQQLNDGLPKYLPQKATVAHKTGDIGWFKHDAGITFTDAGDYIIVIMSESDSPAGAMERIAEVSRAVFNYFDSQ